ncbi:MAG TPA: flavodoxin family protein [Candidatus Gracilibacteria bacterium]
MAHIHIIYATTGGNTDLVTACVQSTLESLGHKVTRVKCEIARLDNLTENDCLILASPTYAHGELEPHMEATWWKKAHKTEIDLTGHPCCVIGLGDDKYDEDYHIESAGLLTRFIVERGGKLVHPGLMINKSPIDQLKDKVEPWAVALHEKLTKL